MATQAMLSSPGKEPNAATGVVVEKFGPRRYCLIETILT
jgi:hypothetical protein